MKLVKMSLVAALLVGSSAFAIENVKVKGDAKLFYSTQDNAYDDTYTKNDRAGLFDQTTSAGEAALSLGVTADLTEGVSAGTTLNAITTLGLYNNLVSGTFTGGVQDNFWFSEAWLAGTTGKTTGKLGRMKLDTPLVFSETWSVVPSTFEAAVLMNQDIADTTLVGAFVGQYNANAALGGGYSDIDVDGDGIGDDARNNVFESFYNGAYAIGAVNNSYKPLTAQAWYYDAPHAANAYWLQADLAMDGLSLGLQYTGIEYDKTLLSSAKNSTNDAFAAKIGYEMKDKFSASLAYSQVGEDKDNGMGAGANLGGSQSKLYTEAWWYYGKITQSNTSAFNVTLKAPVSGYALALYYTQATTKDGFNAGADDASFAEATFEVAKSFGPLDTGLYYIYTKSDNDNQKSATEKGDAYNTVQVYLTYNF